MNKLKRRKRNFLERKKAEGLAEEEKKNLKRQKLSHAWLLRPYALGKLILNNIFLNDISEP